MRYKHPFCAVLLGLLVLIVTLPSVKALAMNTGYTTDPMPEEEIAHFLERSNLTFLEKEPPKSSISCFDANENGLVAIGQDGIIRKTACVYTSDGSFQYGYSFSSYGTFGVGLDGDLLIIYLVRSSVAIMIDGEGNVQDVREIQDTSENNAYWRNYVCATKKEVGDRTYVMKSNLRMLFPFASTSYSHLLMVDENGEVSTVYDAGSQHAIQQIVISVAIVGFLAILIPILVIKVVKSVQKSKVQH